MIIRKLEPVQYDKNKSYYGKAQTIEIDGNIFLRSYDTIVCGKTKENGFERYWTGYSATTQKHINTFCKVYGLETMNKKEWERKPVETCPVRISYTGEIVTNNGYLTNRESLAIMTARRNHN